VVDNLAFGGKGAGAEDDLCNRPELDDDVVTEVVVTGVIVGEDVAGTSVARGGLTGGESSKSAKVEEIDDIPVDCLERVGRGGNRGDGSSMGRGGSEGG
jgi:hypothetical protein